MKRDDRDELINLLFEHALVMHGYVIGILMRGGASSQMAMGEVEPKRLDLIKLYEKAGREVPTYLIREES